MASEPYLKISFNVSPRFYKQLKIECVLKEMTMTAFIKQAIQAKIDADRKEKKLSG